LRGRGFAAIDTDYGDWRELSAIEGNPEWIWREERMRELLTAPLNSSLFVSGCRANQSQFYQYFDHKILLSAPLEVILERVSQRLNNPYGKSEKEHAEICWNHENIQPLLQRNADFEIDTSIQSVSKITDFLIDLALKSE
jgi:shikimate kinase